jgi:hypothetical protein
VSHMTKLPGVRDRDEIVVGMAYFPGTGPQDKTCGDCAHRNRWPGHGDCAMYRKMAGRNGRTLTKIWKACRYFEELQNAD